MKRLPSGDASRSSRKEPLIIRATLLACALTVVLLAGSPAATAQEISAPLVREPIAFKTSETNDARVLMATAPVHIWQTGQPIRVKVDLKVRGEAKEYKPRKQQDPVLQHAQPGQPAAKAAVAAKKKKGMGFDGIPSTGALPPDPIGAVGSNHYIQMVNSAFVIYDKSGKLLAGPSQINSLWKGFGGPCQSKNDGDPVVRYDHLADRWLLSQFAVDDSMQCIAISRDSDPVTGGWFLYAFETKDASGNPVTPDYPKIGVWPDGYYMSTQRGFPNDGMDVWVFERDRMLAGKSARQVQFHVAAPSIVLQPSDLNGPPPPKNTPNFFIRPVDGERFGGQDRIEIFAFSVNWSDPSKSTFHSSVTLPTAPFDSVLCTADLMGACVRQPGTKVRLETLTAWPMFRAQFRNFNDHETLLLNHTVDATGHDVAGVRWYELRRPPGGAWTIFQQGTYAPDTVNRWMGSVAMDQTGHIALGYSVANSKTFPGIRVAIRSAGDPKGELGSEILIVDGGGSQTYAAAPRWGDYGSMDVDPSRPCTFWYTTLYYAKTSDAGWSTRIAEIRVPGCSP